MSKTPIVNTQDEILRVPILTQAIQYVAWRIGRMLLVACYSPTAITTLAVSAAAAVGALIAWWIPTTLAIASAAALGLLTAKKPAAVKQRIYGYWRARHYRFWFLTKIWDCGITPRKPPLHLSTHSTRHVDKLRIRMSDGQRIHDYRYHAERLGQTFGALRCNIRTIPNKPRQLEIWFITHDLLTQPVKPFTIDTQTPLPKTGLPLAKIEDGTTWNLRYMHLLIAAVSGGGKSNTFRCIMWALQPAVQQHLAQLWVICPKGGAEFSNATHLFTRYSYQNIHTHLQLLEDAVRLMRKRLETMRKNKQSQHTPDLTAPAIFLLIDEYMSMSALVPDLKTKKRIRIALAELRTKGRAASIYITVSVIDPRVSVVDDRDQHPIRIGLQLATARQTNSALGEDAHERGAHCDEIDPNTPGVGYVATENGDITRVRFAHITDQMIAALRKAPTPLTHKPPTPTNTDETPQDAPPGEQNSGLPPGIGGFA